MASQARARRSSEHVESAQAALAEARVCRSPRPPSFEKRNAANAPRSTRASFAFESKQEAYETRSRP